MVCNNGMSTETDRQLIANLGGPTKVAELLDLPKYGGVQRIQNWIKRGIPAAVKVQHPQIFMPELGATAAVPTFPVPNAVAPQETNRTGNVRRHESRREHDVADAEGGRRESAALDKRFTNV